MNSKFEEELRKLLSINGKVPQLTADTDLSGLDSLTRTELCVLVEENFLVELKFSEAKKIKDYRQLKELLSDRMGLV